MAIQLSGSLAITGSLLATSTITAQTLNVQQVTSSIVYSSGSNIFGNSLSNTQIMTGSVSITGSLSVNGTSSTLGTGTTNYLPKFTGASTIGNSIVSESGSIISVAGDLYVIKNESGAYRNLVIENSNAGGYARTLYQIGSGGASGIAGVNYAPSIFFKIGMQVNDTSTPIIFVTNNDSEKVRINASGNLSIGNTNDTYKLDVTGTGRFSSNLRLETGASDSLIIFKNNASSNVRSLSYNVADASFSFNSTGGSQVAIISNTGAATFSSSVTAGGKIFTSASVNDNILEVINSDTTNGYGLYVRGGGTATNRYVARFKNGADNDVMWIGPSNVGIGTTSPTAKLVVSGGTANSIMNVSSTFIGTSNGINIGDDGTNGAIGVTNSGTDMVFLKRVAGVYSEAMRIKSDGQIGIGTSTPSIYGLTFANQFTISSTTTYGNLTIAGSSGNSGGIDFGNQSVRHAGVYGLNGSDLGFYTNSTNSGNGLSEKMRITSGGRVGILNTAPQGKFEVGVVDANSTYGGLFFSTFTIPVDTWYTVYYAPSNNQWNAITEFSWTSSGDYNRSGAAYMRWAYESGAATLGVVYTLFNNSQNASASFRKSGNEIQVYITGGSANYYVQLRIQGSRAS